jgi:hypothetical protein
MYLSPYDFKEAALFRRAERLGTRIPCLAPLTCGSYLLTD